MKSNFIILFNDFCVEFFVSIFYRKPNPLNNLKIKIKEDIIQKPSPSGLLSFGSWPEGLFCVWTDSKHKLSKRKKAPPANCPRAEGQRGSEIRNN